MLLENNWKGGRTMSQLIVAGFNDEFKADEVLLELLRNEQGYRINVEDAAVAIRRSDGQILVKQAHVLVSAMASHGSFWGLLVGLLLLNPLAGVVVGGAIGAAIGSLKHIGIEDEFIKELGQKAQPGHSILFVIEHEGSSSSVLNVLKKYDADILETSLGFANEDKLRKALEHKK